MANKRGGRRIKCFFITNEKDEIKFLVNEIVYPHSAIAKKCSGCGEFCVYEQKVFHRPSQAFRELVLALHGRKLINLPIEFILDRELENLFGGKSLN